MEKLSSAELRVLFLAYFKDKDHTVVSSSSLVPADDPTLLFTNAGMVQFKETFLGREKRSYVRAASTQRCVRAGGKHNDLDNVGYTARHHTFFEMLGNFSFGDYFKQDAIRFAWEFLTKELGLPEERLWVTVFEDDDETAKIWLEEIRIDPECFSKIGAKDNFWSMGDTGPCGPCTEIFYDHGEEISGGPPGAPDEDGDRYVEIWNLVFMQYNRDQDGKLTPLPEPSVDTGMGLERLAAIVQGVHNNYNTDLFTNLIQFAADLAHTKDLGHNSLRVIADHIRACAFLIADGVLPSNEGRGYVLRRIVRRAVRHGYRLGIREIFFYQLVNPLCKIMGATFPELPNSQKSVERVLRKEEERFAETLEQGMKILETSIADLTDNKIPGETVFLLYDTYGFPVDLTADFAREHDLDIDLEGFNRKMEAQRDRARAASQFDANYDTVIDLDVKTDFVGYDLLEDDAKIVGIVREGKIVEQLEEDQEAALVLETTPFYAESGGQVGDSGVITSGGTIFEVTDTQKQSGGLYFHKGHLKTGQLTIQEDCHASVSQENRQAIALNHSATHLLHAALREILGDHVTQKGSLVNAERLRFDFSHFEPISESQLLAIEVLVNDHIRQNNPVTAEVMSKDEATATGAMALFGEKYGENVRVLRIGKFSTELCGGTHTDRAGDIGLLKITSETGVASGVRRIEAVTGKMAVNWVEQTDQLIKEIAESVKANRETVENKIQQILEKNRQLDKEVVRLKAKLASSTGSDISAGAVDVEGIKVLAIKLEEGDAKSLRDMVDQLKNKLGSAAIVLALVNEGKVSLVAGVSKDWIDRIKAGELVNFVAKQVGGKGGGRPDMAQAGGTNPDGLGAALDKVPVWIKQQLAKNHS